MMAATAKFIRFHFARKYWIVALSRRWRGPCVYFMRLYRGKGVSFYFMAGARVPLLGEICVDTFPPHE